MTGFDEFYVIDGSFVGLLSAVYEALWRGRLPMGVHRAASAQTDLFAAEGVRVASDRERAVRIWRRLQSRLARPVLQAVLTAHECGCAVADNLIVRFLFRVINTPADLSTDFSDPDLADRLRYSRIASLAC